MKKTIKSYLVFTTLGYRIWVLLVIPLIIVGLTELLLAFFPMEVNLMALFFEYVIVFEIFSDFWLFGGICEKQPRKLEYLKTSVSGMRLLQTGLIMDLVRRFVYLALFSLLCVLHSGNMEYWIMGILIYLVVVAVLNISRYLPILLMQLMVSMAAAIVYLVLLRGTEALRLLAERGTGMDKTETVMIELAALIVLTVGVSIFTVWHAVKRVKGSYYEKGFD